MINSTVVLKIGTIKRGKFKVNDTIDFLVSNYQSDVACDSVNAWLVNQALDVCNYAELRIYSEGFKHDGFLIGTFKRVKMKSGKTRWIVSD